MANDVPTTPADEPRDAPADANAEAAIAAQLGPRATEAPWSPRQRFLCYAGLLAIYLFLGLYYISELPLLDPDEPRYASAGRTMAEGGSWLIPEFNGEKRINKPPLYYWLVALSCKLTGSAEEFNVRLPSLAMALLMLVITVWSGTRLYGSRTGLLAGLVLATAPLYFAMSRACVTDMTFSTFLSAALFCITLGLAGKWPGRWNSSLLAASVLAGLACLTKATASVIILVAPMFFVLFFRMGAFWRSPGPQWVAIWLVIGIVGLLWGLISPQDPKLPLSGRYPAFMPAAYLMVLLVVTYYGLRDYFSRHHWYISLAIFLGLGLWWYVFLFADLGGAQFKALLEYEIKGRLAGVMHKEEVVYYGYIFPGVFFPWSMGMIGALGAAWRKVDAPLPLPTTPAGGFSSGELSATLRRFKVADAFLFSTVTAVVVFFSVPSAKLATYILPAFPAMALLTARLIMRLTGHAERLPRIWRIATLALALLCIELFLILAIGPYEEPRGVHPPRAAWEFALLGAGVLIMVGSALYAALLLHRSTAEDPAPPEKRRLRISGFALPVVAGLAVAAAVIPSRVIELPNRWQDVLDHSAIPLWGLCVILAALTVLPWVLACLQRRSWLVTLPLGAFVVFVVFLGLPMAMDGLKARSSKALCRATSDYSRGADSVFSVGCKVESLSFYLRRPISILRNIDRSIGEKHVDVVNEAITAGPKGEVLMFVHYRYFGRWLSGKAPQGSRIVARTKQIIVLLNEPAGPDTPESAVPQDVEHGHIWVEGKRLTNGDDSGLE